MANQSDTTSHILFCNSEGVMYYDYRPMVTLGAVCIMEENGRMENSYAARAYRKGFEFLSDDLVEILAREAVDNTAILFKAIKPKGGEMPVVMGAFCCMRLSGMHLKLILIVKMFLFSLIS